MKEWVRNIYLLSTNQYLDPMMSKANNNIASQRGDNEIVTQLHVMNKRMDQMANEQREFNVRRVVK